MSEYCKNCATLAERVTALEAALQDISVWQNDLTSAKSLAIWALQVPMVTSPQMEKYGE